MSYQKKDISPKILLHNFENARTRAERVKIKRVVVSISNKARAKGLNDVAKVYEELYKKMVLLQHVKLTNKKLPIPKPEARGDRLRDQIGITIFRKPSDIGSHTWERYLRHWHPQYHKVSLKKYNPHLLEVLKREYPNNKFDFKIETMYPDVYKMYLRKRKIEKKPLIAGQISGDYIFVVPNRFKQINQVRSYDDYRDLGIIVHESLHSINKQYSDLPKWLEEGSVDISTADFIFRNFPSSKKYVSDLRATTYWGEVGKVTEVSMIITKGDRKEALKLVNQLRTYSGDRSNFIARKLRDKNVSESDIKYILSDTHNDRKWWRIIDENKKRLELKDFEQFELIKYMKKVR